MRFGTHLADTSSMPFKGSKQKNIDLSSTVRRNLNETDFYPHRDVPEVAVNLKGHASYDSIGALEALASQNGYSFHIPTLGEASKQLIALTEKQKNADLGTDGPESLYNVNITHAKESSSKKWQKSSKSSSDERMEANYTHLSDTSKKKHFSATTIDSTCNKSISETSAKHRSSNLNKKPQDEHCVGRGKDFHSSEGADDTKTLAPISAKDLSVEHVKHPSTQVRTFEEEVAKTEYCRVKDNVPVMSPTLKVPPALKGVQLYVPKLVITKIKQRRGSKEVETHQVREVLPGSESDLHKVKKRRRSSDESSIHNQQEGMFLKEQQ